MAYATVEDVQSRMAKELTGPQQDVCNALLDDAAVLIDACKTNATDDQEKSRVLQYGHACYGKC